VADDDEEVQPETDEQDVKDLRKNYFLISAAVLVVVLALLIALIVKAPTWVAIVALLVGIAVAFGLYRFTLGRTEQT
jgi:uncharacterized protein (DUF983 family)